ncbi:hypothetical protein EGI15_15875 [Chryseobacterium cucumeris]|uniref:Transposase n=1 Tax=Chryseobacterium cucumeris TaxID=1813611 RepID=A0ABX9X5Z2_9FLAO|nr:hypothetical protein A1704_19550 [Chryseobacterium cucumeris]ROH90151.1 hypothetical protein EGI15_15875 [Chryseobacterium cucumeris]
MNGSKRKQRKLSSQKLIAQIYARITQDLQIIKILFHKKEKSQLDVWLFSLIEDRIDSIT